MLLAELVLDQASVDWEKHLPLMLHVIFLGEFTLAFSWFHFLTKQLPLVASKITAGAKDYDFFVE